MDKQEVLIEVKIDPGVTEDKINKITNSLTFLTAETNDLVEINKTLAASGDKLSSQYVENTKQIEINKNKIAGETAERKTLVKALELEDNSLGALKESSKALQKERDGLNLSTKAGTDRLKEINKQLEDNSDTTKKATSTGKSWKDSIDSVVPGFKGMADGIESGTKAALKFIATPLGAVLALIAGAFALVSSWFTRTEAGGDALAKGMAQLEAIFGVLLDRAVALGGALVKLFTGDFTGAANDAAEAVSGVADEMEREVAVAGQIADALDALEDKERSYKVAMSESANQIKKLIIESKNRKLSEEEKNKKLQDAIDIEKAGNSQLKGIRGEDLKYAIEKIRLTTEGAKMTKLAGETDIEFAKRIIDNDKIQGAAKDDLAEKVIAYNNAEGESLVVQEKINNIIDANIEKMEAKRQKLQELQDKEDAINLKQSQNIDARLLRESELENTLEENLVKRNTKIKEAEDKKVMSTMGANNAILVAEENKRRLEQQAVDNAIDEARRENAERVKIFTAAAMATLDVTSDVFNKRNAITQGFYKNELDAIEIEKRATLSANEEKYQSERDTLTKQLKEGEIDEKTYGEKLKVINQNEKDAATAIDKAFQEESMIIKKKAFEANKKNQIIQTGIDAAQAAVAAFRALAGIPFVGPALGAIAAAAALVYGKRQIDIIQGSQFVGDEGGQVPGGGRWKTLGGNYHNGSKSRGTQFVGSDGTRFLAEKDEGLFILKRSAHADFIRDQSSRNQRFGGRSWQGGSRAGFFELGGSPTLNGSQSSVSSDQIIDIVTEAVAAMPRPVVYVESVNSKQQELVDVESKANLL